MPARILQPALLIETFDRHITCGMKVVLDTDVLVAAIRSSNGASAELIRMARHGEIVIAISVPLVLEYEAKALMPEHLEAGGMSAAQALAVVDALLIVGERTPIHYTYRPAVRDPADEMVLETAINAHADAIVTFNIRDFGEAPARFGIACWPPQQALEALR